MDQSISETPASTTSADIALRMAANRSEITSEEMRTDSPRPAATASYEYHMAVEFDHAHDSFRLVGRRQFSPLLAAR